jgi:deoxycytidylate deaminase
MVAVENLTAKDLRYLNLALQEIDKSEFKSSLRVGASLDINENYAGCNLHRNVIDGKIIYRSLHAEMHVLIRSKRDGKRAKTLYVARLADGRFGNCRPCVECQKWLPIYGVKIVKYTDYIDGKNVLCTWKLTR